MTKRMYFRITQLLLAVPLLLLAFGANHVQADSYNNGELRWTAPAIEAQRKNPVRANGDSVRRGARVYVAHCAGCHGDDGRGGGSGGRNLNPPPSDLVALAPLYSDGDIAWKIANGRGAMPAWKNSLKDRQIWDGVNYIRFLTGNIGGAPTASDGPSDMQAH